MAAFIEIENWLIDEDDHLDQQKDTILDSFMLNVRSRFKNDPHDAKELVDNNEWAPFQGSPTKRQLARYYYLYGRIQLKAGKFDLAVIAFGDCMSQLESTDVVSQVQTLYHLGLSQYQSAQFIKAYQTFKIILRELQGRIALRFLAGDRDTFTELCRFMRARALISMGREYFENAQDDLIRVFAALNMWILQLYNTYHWQPEATEVEVKQLLTDNGYPYLMSVNTLPDEAFKATDQVSHNWYYLLHSAPWQLGMILMWRYILEPEDNNLLIAFSQHNVVEQAGRNLERISSEQYTAPRVMGFGAEIYLEMCAKALPDAPINAAQIGSLKKNTAPIWKQWLTDANGCLREAKTILNTFIEKEVPIEKMGIDIKLLLECSELQYNFEEYRLTQRHDLTALTQLIASIQDLRIQAEHLDIALIVGRCCYLLGRIHTHDGDIQLACRYFHQAYINFGQGDGNELYLEKTRRTMHAIGCQRFGNNSAPTSQEPD